MSIVGTRPPTLDEWNKYELHHRARLAIKPGIDSFFCHKQSPPCLIVAFRAILHVSMPVATQ